MLFSKKVFSLENVFFNKINVGLNPSKPQSNAGPTFCLQARSTRETDIIGREGPVGVGQPGVVRAPSGLATSVQATPANKGTQHLINPVISS